MVDPRLDRLVEQLRGGGIDRRTFLVRASALGMSAFAAGAALRSAGVAAQDASPSPMASPSPGASPAVGGELTPETLGQAGIQHNADTSGGTVKLISSWPMTGASEQIGNDSVAAVELALEVYGGAAGGFAVDYEFLDDGIAANNGAWDATREAENATRAVNDADCMVYLATYNSGAAEAAIPITNEAGLAMISPANTALRLTKEHPTNPEGYPDVLYPSGTRNYMRPVPADDIQGSASANWAYNTKEAQSVFILHDNQTYGLGVAQIFNDTYLELGGEVLGFEPFDPQAPDYQALMTRIAALGPAMIYLGAIVNLNASKLLQDMRAVMPAGEVTFMGPDGLINQSFVDAAGDAAEGAYITFAGLPADALDGTGAVWFETMQERLGHVPDAYAAYSFEIAVVSIQAIDQVGAKDRAQILDAMFNTSEFRGLIGTWSFTETGDTDATTMSLNIVKDGAITFQEDIAPSQ
ncbi:MAG: branched-chain amino acid ABC transporter substrate-binding protein [Chloroflexia bacterium]|nr:branched-chain amino acid ABC transporter substrate-binding protein [Chloroflexia bacterium]